jgi:hypothetical protein
VSSDDIFDDLLSVSQVLPGWAEQVARGCRRYRFWTQRVFEGRAVVAERAGDGPGPSLVITSDEAEMRDAIGLAVQPAAARLDDGTAATAHERSDPVSTPIR